MGKLSMLAALSMLIFVISAVSSATGDKSESHQSETALIKKETTECIPDESGCVCSNKTVFPLLKVGNVIGGVTSQAFLSFNISSVPDGSVIKSVAMDLRRSDMLGDPFHNLGCLKAYPTFYSTLNPEYYYTGLPLGDVMRICSSDDLGNMKKTYPGLIKALQDSVGSSRFQLRLQFDRRDTAFAIKHDSIGEKSPSTGRTYEFGEWKPCLPDEPKSQGGSGGQAGKKDLLQFGTIRMLITYIPPEPRE